MAVEPVAWTQFHPFSLLPFFGPHVPRDLEVSVKDFGIAFSIYCSNLREDFKTWSLVPPGISGG